MEEQLHPEEVAELEKLQNAILAQWPFFHSFGFYLPDFEKSVRAISEIGICSQILFIIGIEFSGLNGYMTIKDAALYLLGKWKEDFHRRLFLTPIPTKFVEGTIKEINRKVPYFHDAEYLQTGFREGLTYGIRIENYYGQSNYNSTRAKGLARHGYRDAINGNDDLLKNYFYKYIGKVEDDWFNQPRFRGTIIDENFNGFSDPEILCREDCNFPFDCLLGTIENYGLAYREKYVHSILNLLTAGKSVAEIRAELFPENEGEGNLTKPDTVAPGMPLQPAEPKPLTEAQKPVLSVLETVLLYFYQRAPMTRETAEKIAKECSESAGHIYSTEYVFKIVRHCNRAETRQQRGTGKRAKENRLQILQGLKEHLPENPILEEDIRTVTTAKNKAKK